MGLFHRLFSSEKNTSEKNVQETPEPPPPQPTSARERRMRERKNVRLPAEMGFGLSGIPESVYVRDFNDQGIYLLTKYALGHGSEIDLYMNVPDGASGAERRVHYVATVKRVDEFRGEGVYGVAAAIRRCEMAPDQPQPDRQEKPPKS